MTNAEVIRDDIIMADTWHHRCKSCEQRHMRIVVIAIQADGGCEAFKIQALQCTDCGDIFTSHTKVSA
jgi:hypothetical protein